MNGVHRAAVLVTVAAAMVLTPPAPPSATGTALAASGGCAKPADRKAKVYRRGHHGVVFIRRRTRFLATWYACSYSIGKTVRLEEATVPRDRRIVRTLRLVVRPAYVKMRFASNDASCDTKSVSVRRYSLRTGRRVSIYGRTCEGRRSTRRYCAKPSRTKVVKRSNYAILFAKGRRTTFYYACSYLIGRTMYIDPVFQDQNESITLGRIHLRMRLAAIDERCGRWAIAVDRYNLDLEGGPTPIYRRSCEKECGNPRYMGDDPEGSAHPSARQPKWKRCPLDVDLP